MVEKEKNDCMGWDDVIGVDRIASVDAQAAEPLTQASEPSEEGRSPDRTLPQLVRLSDVIDDLPELAPELIQGILRCGHKLLLSGPSKAGKSFMLIELAVALAEGLPWLGFSCRKSRVLYVNLEIDDASCLHRFDDIYKALKIKPENADSIFVLNLRGSADADLEQLVPRAIEIVKRQHCDALIIDPIYKTGIGDECSAAEITRLCGQFDRICAETGCSLIYCHHHSKGMQGARRSMDRASGSGVFARDPDALLDVIQLKYTDETDESITAWQMESTLREFKNIKPLRFYFRHPVHVLDEAGDLDGLPFDCGFDSGGSKRTPKVTEDGLVKAFNECARNGEARLSDIARKMGCTDKTIRSFVRENPSSRFAISQGVLKKR